MRVQWEILLFLFCLNLAIGIAVTLNLGGAAAITTPLTPSVNGTEYEQHFNSTEVAQWGSHAAPFSGIPVIGDIFAGFNFLWQNLKYMIDGLPQVLDWIKSSFITDPAGQFAFDVIANVLRGIYALLMSILLIEYIGGRFVSD